MEARNGIKNIYYHLLEHGNWWPGLLDNFVTLIVSRSGAVAHVDCVIIVTSVTYSPDLSESVTGLRLWWMPCPWHWIHAFAPWRGLVSSVFARAVTDKNIYFFCLINAYLLVLRCRNCHTCDIFYTEYLQGSGSDEWNVFSLVSHVPSNGRGRDTGENIGDQDHFAWIRSPDGNLSR